MSTDYPMKVIKIVSGGQTGVDRGALDAALAPDSPLSGEGRELTYTTCPASRRHSSPVRYRRDKKEG